MKFKIFAIFNIFSQSKFFYLEYDKICLYYCIYLIIKKTNIRLEKKKIYICMKTWICKNSKSNYILFYLISFNFITQINQYN